MSTNTAKTDGRCMPCSQMRGLSGCSVVIPRENGGSGMAWCKRAHGIPIRNNLIAGHGVGGARDGPSACGLRGVFPRA